VYFPRAPLERIFEDCDVEFRIEDARHIGGRGGGPMLIRLARIFRIARSTMRRKNNADSARTGSTRVTKKDLIGIRSLAAYSPSIAKDAGSSLNPDQSSFARLSAQWACGT
jgi:hypothetical protein